MVHARHHGDPQRPGEVAAAEYQPHQHDGRIGQAVVELRAFRGVLGVDGGVHLLPVAGRRALLLDEPDHLRKTGAGRNVLRGRVDGADRIAGRETVGHERREEHARIDAVAGLRPDGVLEGHARRQTRIGRGAPAPGIAPDHGAE